MANKLQVTQDSMSAVDVAVVNVGTRNVVAIFLLPSDADDFVRRAKGRGTFVIKALANLEPSRLPVAKMRFPS